MDNDTVMPDDVVVSPTDHLWPIIERDAERLLPIDFTLRLAGSDGRTQAVAV